MKILEVDSREAIEQYAGASLDQLPQELVAYAVERSKALGNAAFKEKRYKEAAELYSQAICGACDDAALFSNRAACHLAMGDADAALDDARRCVALRPGWDKGHYRLGCALVAKGEWLDAGDALQRGLACCPGVRNKAIEDKLAEVRAVVQSKAAEVRASVMAKRRELVMALREARRNDRLRAMIKQHEEQLVPPEWVAEDWEWSVPFRPTHRARGLKGGRAKFVADPRRRGLLDLCRQLAELEQPRRALRVLHDTCRLQAYEAAIVRAVERHQGDPGGARLVTLGACAVVLAMIAARCGAAEVHARGPERIEN